MRFETSTRIGNGDFEVSVNPGGGEPFATIDFDDYHYLRLHSLADCDRILRAAGDVKRRMEAALKGDPHRFESDAHRHCLTCGMLKDAKIHAAYLAAPADEPARAAS